MLFGIGFVFAFLVLLILCIRLMSYLTGRFVSAPAPLRLHRMQVLKQTRTFLQPSRPRFINTARAAVDSGKGVPSMTVAKKPLGITDVVLRDAHQSILATRVRLEDMLPIAAKLDQVGFWSVESWGGATFDACIRYLGEDPWSASVS